MENPFRKPYYRVETLREKLVFILVFGMFIFLFLFLFKPFGMAQLKTEWQFFVSLGFGLVTTFMLFIFKFLLEPVVIKKNWTLGKNILWGLLIASSIGVANYFYVSILFSQIFIFKYFLFAIWTAILVGIMPVTISYIVSFNRIYRTALKEAAILPEEILWESEVIIRAGNQKNEYRFNPKNIVYLCSNDNYVTIVTVKGETLSKTHLRGTLKAAESELKKNTSFFRCHKCYIVNAEYADHVTGNIQNMKIKLKTLGLEIPVSRSKAAEVTRKLK
ncbi:MAG: LytTR family transcriptional regulator DNA-binding domain-containing protein [Bacteroidales bacterium]